MKDTLNSRILMSENQFFGFDLGFAYNFEHMQGIDALKQKFGISDDSCLITKRYPMSLDTIYINNIEYYHLHLGTYYMRKCSNEKDMSTAWSDNSFSIIVSSKYKDYLEEMYNAFRWLNIAIYLDGDKTQSLYIIIPSKAPKTLCNKLFHTQI